MRLLKKTPVTRSLFIFYTLLVIVLGGIRWIEYNKIRQLNDSLKYLTTTTLEKEQLLNNILKSTVYRRVEVLRMIYQSDPSRYKEFSEKIDSETEIIKKDLLYFSSLIKEQYEKQMYDSLVSIESEINLHRATMTQLFAKGSLADARVIDLNVISPLFANFQKIELRLGKFINTLNKEQAANLQMNLNRIMSLSQIVGYILAGILFLFGITLLMASRALIRKKNRLIESEKKYRLFMEQTHDLLVRVDSDGRILSASKNFHELLELGNEHLKDFTIYDFVSEKFEDRVNKIFNDVNKNAGIEDIKVTLISRSGKKIYVQGNLVWKYHGTKFTGATIFLNEVTEQFELLNKLRTSEHKFQKVFHQSPLPKYIAEATSFRFLAVNKAFLDKYGYTGEEILQKTILDIHPASERAVTLAGLQEIINAGILYSGRYQHQKKNGEIMYVEIFGSLIDMDGIPAISVGIVDYTEKLFTENRITRAIIKTQEDERYEIGGELHDNVCQILAAAKMNMDLLKAGLEKEHQNAYQTVLDSIILANEEIRNLSHRLAPVFFEGSSLKGSLEQLLTTINTDNRYHISFYFDESFEKQSIQRDLQLNLYRIAQEAISNITKYAHAKEIRVEVILYKNYLNLLISDNGIGFNTSKMTTGIGIANIKRRTEFFNGSFLLTSSPGAGCEIVVKIPIGVNNVQVAGKPVNDLVISKTH